MGRALALVIVAGALGRSSSKIRHSITSGSGLRRVRSHSAGSSHRYGEGPEFGVRTLAFGLVPAEVTVQVAQARDGRFPDPWVVSGGPVLSEGDHVLAGRNERALYKMIVHPETDVVLGIHMIGPDSPEILQAAAVAVKAGLTKQAFDDTVALHPSMAEELVLMR